jgi:hypothetical protein
MDCGDGDIDIFILKKSNDAHADREATDLQKIWRLLYGTANIKAICLQNTQERS